jgi:hypothetical protein
MGLTSNPNGSTKPARMARICANRHGRQAIASYLALFARAMWLGKAALHEGQLLKDLAWARVHLRVVDVWIQHVAATPATSAEKLCWLDSYAKLLMAPLTV